MGKCKPQCGYVYKQIYIMCKNIFAQIYFVQGTSLKFLNLIVELLSKLFSLSVFVLANQNYSCVRRPMQESVKDGLFKQFPLHVLRLDRLLSVDKASAYNFPWRFTKKAELC